MQEEWRDIKDYEGLYQVSNLGRVKRVFGFTSNGKRCNSKILKQTFYKSPNNSGYYRIGLCKSAKRKMYSVHRLVAQAFIPNPDNLPQVNHKDENTKNNCVDNLEWCTCQYNTSYGSLPNRRAKNIYKNTNLQKSVVARKIPVLQFSIDGTFIKRYDSACDAGRILNINRSGIRQCAIGKLKTSGGYVWKYE